MTFISDIDASTPTSGANAGQGDDEIRQLKSDVKDSFPSIAGAVTATHTELNTLDGATVTTAELNVLDGITTSTNELNYVLDSGATALFVQASAPTGWTKSTSHNNKALRIVSGSGGGSGGSVAFTTAFHSARSTNSAGSHSHSITVNNHTLTRSQIPAHGHRLWVMNVNAGTDNDYPNYPSRPISGEVTSGTYRGSESSDNLTETTGGGGGHNHGASSASAGSHSHTTNLAVHYVDAIICTKDAY